MILELHVLHRRGIDQALATVQRQYSFILNVEEVFMESIVGYQSLGTVGKSTSWARRMVSTTKCTEREKKMYTKNTSSSPLSGLGTCGTYWSCRRVIVCQQRDWYLARICACTSMRFSEDVGLEQCEGSTGWKVLQCGCCNAWMFSKSLLGNGEWCKAGELDKSWCFWKLEVGNGNGCWIVLLTKIQSEHSENGDTWH